MSKSVWEKMQKGLDNLLDFETPPDGEKLSVLELILARPTPAELDAAANLSKDELAHLFIDVSGSFEVTATGYESPKKDKAPDELIALFDRIVNPE